MAGTNPLRSHYALFVDTDSSRKEALIPVFVPDAISSDLERAAGGQLFLTEGGPRLDTRIDAHRAALAAALYYDAPLFLVKNPANNNDQKGGGGGGIVGAIGPAFVSNPSRTSAGVLSEKLPLKTGCWTVHPLFEQVRFAVVSAVMVPTVPLPQAKRLAYWSHYENIGLRLKDLEQFKHEREMSSELEGVLTSCLPVGLGQDHGITFRWRHQLPVVRTSSADVVLIAEVTMDGRIVSIPLMVVEVKLEGLEKPPVMQASVYASGLLATKSASHQFSSVVLCATVVRMQTQLSWEIFGLAVIQGSHHIVRSRYVTDSTPDENGCRVMVSAFAAAARSAMDEFISTWVSAVAPATCTLLSDHTALAAGTIIKRYDFRVTAGGNRDRRLVNLTDLLVHHPFASVTCVLANGSTLAVDGTSVDAIDAAGVHTSLSAATFDAADADGQVKVAVLRYPGVVGKEGPSTPEHVAFLAAALDALHARGRVHGDVRGSNVICGTQTVLIDADMGGDVGRRQYPTRYTIDIPDGVRHPHAVDGQAITVAHDQYAFAGILRKYFVLNIELDMLCDAIEKGVASLLTAVTERACALESVHVVAPAASESPNNAAKKDLEAQLVVEGSTTDRKRKRAATAAGPGGKFQRTAADADVGSAAASRI